MTNAGRILIIPRGDWSNLTSYDMLDLVTYNDMAYIARQASVGVNPRDDTSKTYWQPFGTVVDIATTSVAGIVKPDGTTIAIEADGTISVDASVLEAGNIDYDNTSSGLTADDVQDAIDEVNTKAESAAGYLTSAVTGAVGATSVTINDAKIRTTSLIDAYCSNSAGVVVGVTSMVVSNGSAVLSFDALEYATDFKLMIR